MRKGLKKGLCVSAAVVLLLIAGAAAKAQETKISGNVAYVSSYIWRGFDLLPDDEPAIQPGVSVSLPGSVAIGLWASYGLDSEDDLDEFDVTVTKSGSFGESGIGWSVGHTYYTFPVADQDSQETFGTVTFTEAPTAPAVGMYYDWGDGDGVYVSVSGGYDFKPAPEAPFSMRLGYSAGYSDGQWGIEPGVSDVALSLSAAIPAGKTTITPSVNYVITPGDRANTENEFWAGINICF